MPTGSLKDQLPQHFSLFISHLTLGLILLSTPNILHRQWDWLVIDGLGASYHLRLAAESFAIILLGLAIFGSAILLGVLPALVLITIAHVLCCLPCSLLIFSLVLAGIGA
ncbi:hypothetical protein F5B22DRAFT_587882 [Xylaria bambusicola]|uniref:uncharacterized protein n=1 Tax=Xylaria bambusicola TaxID=326684 RepID=UPI002007BA46|nr:uncharacterized protein F5B22DRAFT_587882 [Xylaria bambusicola]KAI0525821.1 hypothetical protein F5B22DRAFT_587882 [Xylaria bambusicola]